MHVLWGIACFFCILYVYFVYLFLYLYCMMFDVPFLSGLLIDWPLLSTHADVITVIINLVQDWIGYTWSGIWSCKGRKLRICTVTGTWVWAKMRNKTGFVFYTKLKTHRLYGEDILLMDWKLTDGWQTLTWRYRWCWTSKPLSLEWWNILFKRGRAVPARYKVGHCYLMSSQPE